MINVVVATAIVYKESETNCLFISSLNINILFRKMFMVAKTRITALINVNTKNTFKNEYKPMMNKN